MDIFLEVSFFYGCPLLHPTFTAYGIRRQTDINNRGFENKKRMKKKIEENFSSEQFRGKEQKKDKRKQERE